MVRFLLQHDANVHTTTSHGYTPLHQAAQQGHTLVVNLLLENQASPNVTTMQGQTPLSIAQRLGYISVVETLKVVTETTVTTTTTTVTEEKYKVVAPETMQETFMTDSEDEGGADFDEAAIFGKPTHATHVYLPYVEGQNFQISEEAMLGDQSYRYISADELKSLGDDSLPIDVTKDEKQHDVMQSVKQFGAPMVEEDNLSPQHVTPVESGFVEKFSPDNIDLTRVPVHAGFLVSFMVDARGGAMRGCRHSGVRVIIPPRKASMPMRITCRYLRKEKLIHPPPLMEGEACASRILEMGPVGARFLGPVIIEVPHFASTRGKEREITILRSDTGENWREHTLEASEEAVQEVLNESFEGEELSALEDLNTNRITRILTTDFPQYFAIVTRVRQEVHGVGPEGGMVSSTVVPQVQAIFPEGALTKKIRVGLQAQPIAPELVAKLLGNRVAVSPIVTVEPRRRKFHKPITLTIPVPQAATKGMINQYSGDAPTLRLLCSITGGSSKAQWEDVTGSTPLTFVNDCVSFTTTVSARFWLMDCRQVPEVTRYATELYQEAVYVPFMSKFVIFAKRHDPYEAQLRVFCMTDDKEDKTLESQEHFTEVAKSRDVEVLEGKLQYLEFAGNLVPVTKSGEQLKLTFQAFHENRLPFTVRVKDPHIEPMGRIAFMKEPKTARGEPPQVPICNLNVVLPDIMPSELNAEALEMVTLEKRYDYIQEAGLSKPELIHRADLRLSDIARELDKDWLKLAQQLDVTENDIEQIKAETTYDQSEQALMMLRLWLQKSGSKATGNELEKGLRKINREDIIKNCMFNVELVTDDVEKAVAKVHLDQSGFDVFKEELGSSREASMRRGASLDISYDEQDIMKEAESAAETSSETGSLFERDQLSQALTDDKDACQTDVVGTQSPVNDSTISADKVAYISSSAEQCESSGPSALQVNNLNMQSVPVSRNDNIHVSLETQSVQAFENKINNTTYNKELENVVNGSDNYILKIEQSSKKLHEFWPPDKVPETYHSIVYSMQESSDIKSSPFILDESVSNNSFNKESSLELQQNKKNEIMDPNINLSNIIGDDIENSNAYLNDNMNVSEYDKPIAKEISTNSKPLIDPSEKDALDNEKASEINDLGYCSLDKDINDSSNLMTDNIRHEDSLPSEIVSDKYNLGHEQTPSCDSFDKEVLLENTDLHPYSILHSEQTINDTCDTVLENTYDNSERNSSLKELQKHEEMPSNVPTVSHSMPKSTVVNPAHTEVNILQSDESIVVTENSSQSLDYDDKNTENSSAEDAKIRRPSKTPPPSPADEIDKVYGDIEKVKDVPAAATVTNEVKDAHVRLSGEIEIRPMEGAGEVGGQELLARLTESETWPSGDLDTSQVSVSSLPDDEKSEPTTATVSSAAATTADDRSTAVSETVEKTQDDGCGITTHIIQKTTHMTISVQEKPEEEFDDKKQLIAEEGKLDTDQNLVSDTKQEEKKEDNMVCSVDKSVSEEREQETGDQFQAGENVLRESFETSIGQLAEETAIISVVSGDATVKEIREQSVKTIGEKSKPVESVVSSIDDIVSTSPDHILNLTEIPFAADQSELPMDHPLLSTKTDIKLVEEGLGCDATDGRTITKTIVSSLPSECTEQMVVHTTTTRTSVSSFETEDEPPSDSKDQMKQSKQE
ncbi:Ankyrin-3, partial [Stegodyphus mimosarum]